MIDTDYKRRKAIGLAVAALWESRCYQATAGAACNVIAVYADREKTGDWTLAAYAVGKGMDVLELERMVRNGA